MIGRRAFFAGLLILSMVGCSSTQRKNEYLVASTLWFQTAGEARALSYQAFNLAKRVLDEDLKKKNLKSKRAIIVDVDETVLDNSPYEAHVIATGNSYPVGWDDWIDAAQAKPLPGSVEFLNYAHQKGVAVFYVTNRKQKRFEATLKNLKEVGFPNVTEETLLCRTGPSSKTDRRDKVRANHRIVLLMGDNLNDFSYLFESETIAARQKAVDGAKDKFGAEFILIPNPMYGDWEAAVYEGNFALPAEEKAERRFRNLSVFETSKKKMNAE